jgi:hypothetical protein
MGVEHAQRCESDEPLVSSFGHTCEWSTQMPHRRDGASAPSRTRREFLNLAANAGFLVLLGEAGAARGGNESDGNHLDRFGGWIGKQFEATGFFRTEHDGKRWWLVTPEGNAFISFGVNHYHAGWWAQEYNRDHWMKVFGAQRPWDPTWQRGFRDAALADLRRLGLNTLGIHTDAPMLTEPPGMALFPYVARYEPLVLSHYRKPSPETYADVFAPEYEAICEVAAREMAEPYANDPMILGYCMADVPAMTDNDAEWHKSTTWPRRLRNLGADSPGKQAYVDTMRNRHADIADFNTVYITDFVSWDALLAAEDWRPSARPTNQAERDDNAAFLLLCVDKYYSVAKAALRRVDSNHLFLGDKINANSDAFDTIVGVTSRYTDVVNIQYYARWEKQKATMDRWSDKVGQPFLNGDSAMTTPTEDCPNPYGPHAKDQAERAEWTREFMENATARPDFVGWHMCGMIDTSKEMPGKEQHQHQGLMTTHGEFYPEMEQAVQQVSSRLYNTASGT